MTRSRAAPGWKWLALLWQGARPAGVQKQPLVTARAQMLVVRQEALLGLVEARRMRMLEEVLAPNYQEQVAHLSVGR